MPNPDPSPATRFTKGRPKTGGRQKGTPNKPITVKMAMKTFTNEKGAELMAFADEVMNLPNWLETEKGYCILLGIKVDVWREALRYGIGKHANQAPDTGRGGLIFHTKFPLGTDPDAMDRWFEEEAIRRGLIKGGQPRLQAQAPQKDRGKIFNQALLRAVGKAPQKARPPEVVEALTDEEGNELEVVEHELPKIYEPDQQLRDDE